MSHVTQPLIPANISIFSPEIRKFYYIKKYNSLNFFWVFKAYFNKHDYNVDNINNSGYSRPFFKKELFS